MIKNIFKGLQVYTGAYALISKLKLWKYFIIPFLKVRNFIKKDKPSKKIKFKKTRLEKQIEKGFLCSTFVWYMLYYIGEIDYITYVGKVPSPRHLLVYLNKTGKVKPLIKIN